ncbi:MAG: cupredoxin domain-containing protein [Actinomycetia bacterium]|nr:cupredoxin domain-containing protein [Actinomycetes bacterium]
MRLRKTAALAFVATTALTMTACSQSDSPATAPQPSASGQSPEPSTSTSPGKTSSGKPSTSAAADLTISGFAFSELSVTAGTKITVTNEDTSDHTVTVKGTSTDVNVPAGGTATFDAPDQPGSYDLTCDFHPAMSGTLMVTG